jgi:hypothetical protein
LFGLDPEASPLEELVAQLRGEIEPERLVPAAIAHILAASASWPGEHALFDSFDEGDEIAVLLAGKRQSKSRTLAAILAGPIDQRRPSLGRAARLAALLSQGLDRRRRAVAGALHRRSRASVWPPDCQSARNFDPPHCLIEIVTE